MVKIWDRSKIILYKYLNQTVFVYNGKEFKKLVVTRDKIGFCFGEFCFTRSNRHKNKLSLRSTIKK